MYWPTQRTFQFGGNRHAEAIMSKIQGVTEVREVNCQEKNIRCEAVQNQVSFATNFSGAKPLLQVSSEQAMVIALTCKVKHGISFLFSSLRHFKFTE